ncbi:MAG: glycosyltransferase [Bacteroidales bacterium]|nr:glycosyltransferase [Bacteroidales bacterium]
MKENEIDISVIIPSYKPKSYIWQCLDSLKNQTFEKERFEIILILNGCKEPFYSDTVNFVNENFEGYAVKVLQTDTPGVSNARNIGIDNARGRYITFLDDDDYLSECFLEKMFPIAEKGIIPMSNMTSFSDNDNSVQPYYVTEAFRHLYKKGVVSPLNARSYLSVCVAKLLPADLIRTNRFNTSFKIAEDCVFMFTLSKDIKAMQCSDEDAIYYRRIRESSALTSHRSRKTKIVSGLKLILQYNKIYFGHPFRYNFILFLTRIAGTIKNIF